MPCDTSIFFFPFLSSFLLFLQAFTGCLVYRVPSFIEAERKSNIPERRWREVTIPGSRLSGRSPTGCAKKGHGGAQLPQEKKKRLCGRGKGKKMQGKPYPQPRSHATDGSQPTANLSTPDAGTKVPLRPRLSKVVRRIWAPDAMHGAWLRGAISRGDASSSHSFLFLVSLTFNRLSSQIIRLFSFDPAPARPITDRFFQQLDNLPPRGGCHSRRSVWRAYDLSTGLIEPALCSAVGS